MLSSERLLNEVRWSLLAVVLFFVVSSLSADEGVEFSGAQFTNQGDAYPIRSDQTAKRKSIAPFSVQQAGYDVSTETQAFEPLPIAPPTKSRRTDSSTPSKPTTPAGALATVISSLAIVLGLFMLVVWFTRRALPNASTSLPAEVIETLGRAPLGTRQNMHLVRLGNKLLLLCVSANGTEALTEITDREEVDRIAGLCQQNQPGSISTTFRQVLSQFSNESAVAENSSSNRNRAIAESRRRPRTIESVEG